MKPKSIDAIVTDPPYGLEFMGKKWDKLWDKREFGIDEYSKKSYTGFDGSTRKTNPVSRKLNNPNYKAGIEAQLWHSQWLTEAYRALKPGGSILAMGGTRTFHRLACAIEDSGFIIKDTLMWLYGSGFPKAQDLGKLIDKRMGKEGKIIGKRINGRYGYGFTDKATMSSFANKVGGSAGFNPDKVGEIKELITEEAKHWDGFKVGGIKPAYEPIIWAVKPPEGSYVDNVLKWGVGAVNVDECRIEHNGNLTKGGCTKYGGMFGNNGKVDNPDGNSKGRFPANVILDEEAGRILDEQSGSLQSGENPKRRGSAVFKNCYGDFQGNENCLDRYSRGANSGGASRFFYCAKASRGERNAGLEELPDKLHGQLGLNKIKIVKNNHPTVKPIKLFEWLIKLVTREEQIVLDPFIGSGTTAIAAHNTGRKCVGIEKEDEYIEIAKRRIKHGQIQPHQLALGE